jgi:hypothetical protein
MFIILLLILLVLLFGAPAVLLGGAAFSGFAGWAIWAAVNDPIILGAFAFGVLIGIGKLMVAAKKV